MDNQPIQWDILDSHLKNSLYLFFIDGGLINYFLRRRGVTNTPVELLAIEVVDAVKRGADQQVISRQLDHAHNAAIEAARKGVRELPGRPQSHREMAEQEAKRIEPDAAVDEGKDWIWAYGFKTHQSARQFGQWLRNNQYEYRGIYVPLETGDTYNVRFR